MDIEDWLPGMRAASSAQVGLLSHNTGPTRHDRWTGSPMLCLPARCYMQLAIHIVA